MWAPRSPMNGGGILHTGNHGARGQQEGKAWLQRVTSLTLTGF